MPAWIGRNLYAKDRSGELKKHFNGTGIQHFTGEGLAKFPVPIPPAESLRQNVEKFRKTKEYCAKLEDVFKEKHSTRFCQYFYWFGEGENAQVRGYYTGQNNEAT